MLTNISANNIESRICIGDHEFHISEKKHAPACSLVFHDSQTGANKKISLGIVLPHIPNVKGVDVQAVHNELSVFDISGFSRPQIAVLLALIEASKDEFKCEGAQQGLYTLLARDLVDFARKDIEAQGNSALIGSVVSAAAGAACGAITAFHEIKASTLNIKASELNQRSSNLNLFADGQDKTTKKEYLEKANDAAKDAKVNAALATKSVALATVFKLVGESITGLSGGLVKKLETSYESLQKAEEQNAHIANSLTDATNQEKQRIKDLLNQVLRLLQDILADQKQASDAAATMKC